MHSHEPVFVIPTYRLKDVGKAVAAFDAHFHQHGHSIPIWVFDDSTYDGHRRYYGHLERTPTFNEVFYVGPREKSAFLAHVQEKTGTDVADSIIYRMFRPSYGGNRNFILAYTLGRKVISSDDDMLPGGYVSKDANGDVLADGEVMRAETVSDLAQAEFREYDLYAAFLNILGTSPETLGIEMGEYLEDPCYDLETNAVKDRASVQKTSSLHVKPLDSPLEGTRVRFAQTYRTGTSDLDAVELLALYLNSDASDVASLSNHFVLQGFKPVVTRKNWRFDCGVSAVDNDPGLPPFLPTRLRFEDYSQRLWSGKRSDVAAAHVSGVQHHTRSLYMRPPLTAEVYNEAVANFLKGKLKGTLTSVGDFNIKYDYDGRIRRSEVAEILDQARALDAQVQAAMSRDGNQARQEVLAHFRDNLSDLFRGYDADLFTNDFSRRIDEENYGIRDCMTYWERMLEASSWRARSKGLPMRKVANRRR